MALASHKIQRAAIIYCYLVFNRKNVNLNMDTEVIVRHIKTLRIRYNNIDNKIKETERFIKIMGTKA